MRGTSQNPDVYFQGRETVNRFYLKVPEITKNCMDRFAGIAGRSYKLYEYYGAPDAERVIVLMGSASETVRSTIDFLAASADAKLGLITVRLFRPFSVTDFVAAIPKSASAIAVLDRTKETAAPGEPLYMDVRTAISEAMETRDAPSTASRGRGRHLRSRLEGFTPAMVKAVFNNLAAAVPKNRFTVGITDDVTEQGLDVDQGFTIEGKGVFGGMFFGLGADGTVGANKSTSRLSAERRTITRRATSSMTPKKSGSITVSHLRFGKEPIRNPYLLSKATFIACHNRRSSKVMTCSPRPRKAAYSC